MKKLAIVDLDGVVANSEARFEIASQDGSINWEIAFDPDNVKLDILIDDAYEHIFDLQQNRDYKIIYLTSRPMSMYAATWEWLRQHDLSGPELICKPEVKKYTKTIVWKADEVEAFAKGYGHILFIDDEEKTRSEVMKRALSQVECFESLAQALEALGDQDDEEGLSPEAEIIMQNVDPSVRNAYEEEIVNPSTQRPRDDGGPALIV